jgi:hypothetical protein
MLQAALTGVLVALSAGFVVPAAGRLVRARLDRRRMAEWAAAWERNGPPWRKEILG